MRFEGDDNAASIPDPEALARDAAVRARRAFSISRRCGSAFAVVAAGPVANFLLAILVFAAVFTLIGRPHIVPVAETVVAGSAAERAGIKPGDRIVSVDGNAIESFSELQSIVMLSADETLSIVVDRNGEQVDADRGPRAAGAARPAGRHAPDRRPRHHRRRRSTSSATIR